MNRIYRLVWSHVTRCLIPVPEVARGHRRGGRTAARTVGAPRRPKSPVPSAMALGLLLCTASGAAHAVTPVTVGSGQTQTFYGDGAGSNGVALTDDGTVNLATTATQTYTTAGLFAITAPAGSTGVNATVAGAGGGGGTAAGGAGRAIANILVPYTSLANGLDIVVGAGGASAGTTQAGGGGGASGLFDGTPSQSDALVVAGGGGGGGGNTASGGTATAGGTAGAPVSTTSSAPAYGTGGGASGSTTAVGGDGTAFGSGGAGGTTNGGGFGGGGGGGSGSTASGGGGGGGYVGGSGGAAGAGGGGGQSEIAGAVATYNANLASPNSYTQSADNNGGAAGTAGANGSITLEFLFPTTYTMDTLSGTGQINTGTGANAMSLAVADAGDNGSGSGTFGGAITGAGGFTVGGGTETLSGTDTYTGATAIDSGATLVLAGSGSIASSGSVTDTGTLDISGITASGHSVNISALTGTGAVDLGANTLIVSASGTTAAQPALFGGVLRDGGAAGGTGGSLAIAGGFEELAGQNTYTGATTIDGGAELLLGNTGALAQSSGVTDSGTLDLSPLGGGIVDVVALQGAGVVNLGQSQGVELALTNAGGVFIGTIEGAGNLAVNGGVETLGGANTFTGQTLIGANANLILGNSSALADSANVSDQGTLNVADLASGSVADINSLSDPAATGVVDLGANTLDITNGSGNFDGVITGAGGALSISGNPSGQFEYLSGSNTYTGATTIDAGASLGLAGTGSIAQSSGVNDNGTFDIAQASGATTSTSSAISTGVTVSIQALTGDGAVSLGNNDLTIENASPTGSPAGTSFAGALSGKGGLTLGAGTQTLTGVNSYTGVTTIDAGATLALAGVGSVSQSQDVIDSGVLDISGSALPASAGPVADNVQSLDGGGVVALGGNDLAISHANGDFTGAITGTGGLWVAGGTESLGGVNTYTGTTFINQGAGLTLVGAGSVGTSTLVQDEGTLDISGANAPVTLDNLSGATGSLVDFGTQSLVLDSGASGLNAASDTFAGVLAGNGGLTVATGTQTLQGINRYFGTTTIDSGAVLGLAQAGSIGDSSHIINNGTLDVSGVDTNAPVLVQSLSGGTGSGVNLGANSLDIAAGTDTYGGVIAGSGGLIVSGGEETLGNASTYTGATVVDRGAQLNFTGNGSIADSNGLIANGTVDISAITPQDFTVASSVSGTGEINLGSKTLVLASAASTPGDWAFTGLVNGSGSAGYYTSANTFITLEKGQGAAAPAPITGNPVIAPAAGQTQITVSGNGGAGYFLNNQQNLTINNAVMENYVAQGGAGSGGGAGLGGAVFVGTGSSVVVNNTTFQNNTAIGGEGGIGTAGGSLDSTQATQTSANGLAGATFGGQPFQAYVHLTGGSGTDGQSGSAASGGSGGNGGAGASYGPITGINSFGEQIVLQEQQVAEAVSQRSLDISNLAETIAGQLKDASDLVLDANEIASSSTNAAATSAEAAATTAEGADLTTLGAVDTAVAVTDGVSAAADGGDAADPFEAPLAATDAAENVAKAVEDAVAAGVILASDSTVLATDATASAAVAADTSLSTADAAKIAADIYQINVDLAAEVTAGLVIQNDTASVNTNIAGLQYLVTNSNNGLEGYLAAAAAGTIGQGSEGGAGGLGGSGAFGLGGGAGGSGGNGGAGASVNETLNLADVLQSLGFSNDPYTTGQAGLSGTVSYIGGASGGNGGNGAAGGEGGFGAGGGSGGNGGLGGASGNAANPSWVGQVGLGGAGGVAGFGGGTGSSGSGLDGPGGFGGGGSGFGGAIFVNSGGALTVTGDSLFKGNQVIGGTSLNGGAAGQAAGTALFIMKGADVTLDPGAGHVITFDDGIADNSAASITGSALAAGNGASLNIGDSAAPGTDTGLVIFNGTNTYSGQTNIYSGVLQAVDGVGIDGYSNINIAGGVLQTTGTFSRFIGTQPNDIQWTAGGGFSAFGGGLTVSLNNGDPLTWGSGSFEVTGDPLVLGSSSAQGATTFTNAINLNGSTDTVIVQANAANTDTAILSGVLSNGGLTLGGSGILQLTAANTYQGETTINAGATMQLTGVGSVAGSQEVLDNGILDVSGVTGLGGADLTTLAGGGEVILGDTGLILTDAGSNGTNSGGFAGAINGLGGLTVQAGTETLSGANGYNGPTTIDQGAILQLQGNGSIANTEVVNDNGTFAIGGANASGAPVDVLAGSLAGSGAVDLGANNLILAAAFSSFTGVLSGTGGLTVASGSEGLGGATTYTGATTIGANATLALTGGGSIADSSGVSDQGLFDISAASGPESVTTLSGAGNVNLGANALFVSHPAGTLSGTISGSGGVGFGAGAQTLTGASTYTGGTTLNGGGTVSIGAADNLGAGPILFNGGTLEATAGFTDHAPLYVSAQNGTIDNGGSSLAFTGNISYYGTPNTILYLTGTGGTGLDGTITGVTIDNEITGTGASGLQLGSSAHVNAASFTSSGSTTMNAGSEIHASGSFTNGGTLTLGSTTLIAAGAGIDNAGTLDVGVPGTGSTAVAQGLPTETVAGLPAYAAWGVVLPTGVATLQGNYTSSATSTTDFAIAPGGYTQLGVTGAINLGGQLTVQAASGALPFVRNTYVLMNNVSATAQLSGQFNGITVEGLPQGDVYRVLYVTEPALVLMVYNPNQFVDTAQTANETTVGAVLDSALPTAAGTLFTELNALYGESPAGQAASLNQMGGEGYADAGGVLRATTADAWTPVFDHMGLGATSPQKPLSAHHDVWLATTGGLNSFGDNGNASGLSSSEAGTTMGAAWRSGPFTAGVAGGYDGVWGNLKAPGAGTLTAHLWQIGAYGDWRRGADRVGMLVGYSGGRLAASRSVSLGTSGYNAAGSAPVGVVTAGIRAASSMHLRLMTLTPIAGLDYSWTHIGGLSESGGGPLGLAVAHQNDNSLDAQFVMRMSRSFSWLGLTWAPSASAGLRQALLTPSSTVQETFAGIPGQGFAITGTRANRTMGVVSASLHVSLTQDLDARVSYEGAYGSSTTLNTFSGNLTYRW